MAAKKPAVSFKLGDRVKIRDSNMRGRIVGMYGALGPGGAHVYRVRYRGRPIPANMEVLEEQLELIPDDAAPAS